MNSLPLILGHRGASAVTPENTLAAFSRALEDGADGIEFDVRLSRDCVPVVIHDATLKRTGLIDLVVDDLTSDDLRQIDVGAWFQPRADSKLSYAREKLPTLAQVFDLFRPNRGILYLEMKCEAKRGSELAAEVVKSIRMNDFAGRVVVESFDLHAIAEIKRIDSGIRTAALFEPKLTLPLSTLSGSRLIDLARRSEAEEIALHHSLARPQLIRKALAEGFEVVVWTVDDPRWVKTARSLGIKALISNDPARMIRARNRG